MRRNAIALFGLRILKAVFSIAILSLSAHFFGVSVERDIWILASNCILVLDLAIWGPINETFRAKFIFLKEEQGEDAAVQKATSLFLFTSVITVCLTLIILLFPELLGKIIAPVYYSSDKATLIFMIRLVAPSFLINQIIQLGIGVLNAYKSFYMPEIAGLISSALNILILIFLAPVFGIYSLVISFYLGLLILLGLVVIQLKKVRLPVKKKYIKEVNIKEALPFVIFAVPFFLPYFTGQLNLIAEKSIANILGSGKVSLVDYSRKFIDIPVNALSSVLTTMLLPTLSTFFSAQNSKMFVTEFKRTLQLGLLILTLVIGGLILNASSIVSLLYGSSKISQTDTMLMIKLVQAYSCSAFSIFLYIICGIAMIASGKGRIYALFGVIAQIIMIGMNYFMYDYLDVFTFPLSLFVSHLIAAILLYLNFPVQKKNVLIGLLRYSLFLILAIALPFIIINNYLFAFSPFYSIFINTILLVSFGTVFIFLMGFEEKSIVF